MSKTGLKKIIFIKDIMMGCDPEFFFADKNGKVVGSEKVLTKSDNRDHGLVIDGVQAELNPAPSFCRELLASNIQGCFRDLRNVLQRRGIDVAVKVDSLVDITQAELDSLSEESKVFGCDPSTNIYEGGESKIKVDPKKYLKRSAGGHIHLGNSFKQYLDKKYEVYPSDKALENFHKVALRIDQALKKSPDIMVSVLDIIVGNTCVLMDRSKGNKERRANYGRAGEYRVKPYGLEYRSLSNFWLRSYPLMSFVMGLCRFAVHCVSESTPENDYVKALFNAVKREDIVKAINENDFDLAMKNFKKIEQFFIDVADEISGSAFYPLRSSTIKYFYHFVFRIQKKGIEYWFSQDPMAHWCGQYGDNGGWENFSDNIIYDDLAKYDIEERKRKRLKAVFCQ